ncbi:MAG TPA: hypothetical protein VG797_03800 [Phycisphaerales bacterium]|nr:hypothetical protein [Phycisphaerales bacterium]
MFAKLAALILMLGLTASGMLVIRQQRLQAVSEMTSSTERAANFDRALWRVRVKISRAITPAKVRQMAAALGPMKPIEAEWGARPVWCEPDLDLASASAATPPRAKGAKMTPHVDQRVARAGDDE